MLIGLGPGSLQLEVDLVDGRSGQVIESFGTSGGIYMGGIAGMMMGIDDLVGAAANRIAERIQRYSRTDSVSSPP